MPALSHPVSDYLQVHAPFFYLGFDRADVVFQTVKLTLQKAAAAKQVGIVIDLDAAVPRMELDALKIEQATLNLAGNAIEHTRPGTTVRLTARRDGGNVIVAVSDQGPGIPPEMMDKLFQPFARGGGGKTAGYQSHGLGLAIAKRMVEAHHGRIWAENQPDAGATFFFMLPIKPSSEPVKGTP